MSDKSTVKMIKPLGLAVKDIHGRSHDDAKLLGLILFGIVLNFICNRIAGALNLPFYLDCIGTIAAALIGGFVPGVMVGFFTNVVIHLFSKYIMGDAGDVTLYYCVVSVLIGLLAAFFSQNKYFKKVSFKTLIPVLGFVILGGGLGSVISWGLFGNTLGDQLASSLANKIYVDFLWTLWAKTRVPYAGQPMEDWAVERYARMIDNIAAFEAL